MHIDDKLFWNGRTTQILTSEGKSDLIIYGENFAFSFTKKSPYFLIIDEAREMPVKEFLLYLINRRASYGNSHT